MMTIGTIAGFCDELLKDDCPETRLEPEGLAEDFSRYFGVRLRLSVDDIAVLLENAGIGVVSGARLAKGLRGVHYIQPDETYAIHYLDSQWEGGKVHTVLHETYEIVHEQVRHRRHGSPLDRSVCPQADRFAAAVMMPPDTFEAYALATGLDVLALQKVFRCAYFSVTRRLGEVMRRQPRRWSSTSARETDRRRGRSRPILGSSGPRRWFGRRGSMRNLRACSLAPRVSCPWRTGVRPPAHWQSG